MNILHYLLNNHVPPPSGSRTARLALLGETINPREPVHSYKCTSEPDGPVSVAPLLQEGAP